MNTVIKGAKTITEYIEKQQRLADLTELAYQKHRKSCDWKKGEPVKAWYGNNDTNSDTISVQYANGDLWHYKNLELPFSTWWQ